MTQKKKAKKKPIAKKIKKPTLPVAIQAGSPEDVCQQGAAPAIALVQRAQDLLKDIGEITDELEDRQERLANVKDQLRSIKFNNSKISVEFGWNEGPETPGVRVGIFAGREFAYIEASLEELDEMVEWCVEQLNGKPKQFVNL